MGSNLVRNEGVGGGTLSRSQGEAQDKSSTVLRAHLITLAERVKRSKLPLEAKVTLLGKLVKSHESLTKTERLVAGLGDGGQTGQSPGIILVPVKIAGASWHEQALAEVQASRDMQVFADAEADTGCPCPKESERAVEG